MKSIVSIMFCKKYSVKYEHLAELFCNKKHIFVENYINILLLQTYTNTIIVTTKMHNNKKETFSHFLLHSYTGALEK